MNQQQFFDDVKAHLLTQMKQSVVHDEADIGDNQCLYTGPNGLRCAIGGLLPKGMDTSEFEDSAVFALIDYPAVVKALAKYDIDWHCVDDKALMAHMQELHDDNKPEDWAACLVKLAERYELKG